jgi:periplasmic protein CpxP/Spy
MRNATKVYIAMLTLAMGLALSPALRAQETPGSAAPQNPGISNHDRMMGDGTNGMMMGQMSQMMDQCSRMMQSMTDRQGPKSPNQPQDAPPANPGSKG